MKRIRNARGNFVSYSRGYLYIPVGIVKMIENYADFLWADVDITGNHVTITIGDTGEYATSKSGSGYKVCVYSDRGLFESKRYEVKVHENVIEFDA